MWGERKIIYISPDIATFAGPTTLYRSVWTFYTQRKNSGYLWQGPYISTFNQHPSGVIFNPSDYQKDPPTTHSSIKKLINDPSIHQTHSPSSSFFIKKIPFIPWEKPILNRPIIGTKNDPSNGKKTHKRTLRHTTRIKNGPSNKRPIIGTLSDP